MYSKSKILSINDIYNIGLFLLSDSMEQQRF